MRIQRLDVGAPDCYASMVSVVECREGYERLQRMVELLAMYPPTENEQDLKDALALVAYLLNKLNAQMAGELDTIFVDPDGRLLRDPDPKGRSDPSAVNAL